MRALLVQRPGAAGVVELPVGEPGRGELLVRVGAAGICGSDVELLEGTRAPEYVRYPIVPGHEWAGIVAAVGPEVAGVREGNVVVAEGIRPCGLCDRCSEGRTNLCEAEYAETGFTHAGAFAEYVVVPAALAHVLPDGSDLEAAALLEPAACVANGLLEAGLRPGVSAAVVGSGTLGLLAVALIGLASPSRLAIAGTRGGRLALARRLGATEAVDVGERDPVDVLGSDFDLVFEAATRPDAAATAIALVRRGGTVVLEGLTGNPVMNLSSEEIALKHVTVHGIFGASREAWHWVVSLFASGRFDPSPLVTHRFPLERHEDAFAALRASDAVKVELVPAGAV
jgi:2-desacetyl-2-hydroxyethyl bacteriochlorophyllide A dehydrogenase